MFNPDKTFATVKHVAEVITELGKMFDTLSKVILHNKKDIKDLQARIKEIEDTFIIKEDKK